MALKSSEIVKQMLAAAKGELDESWPKVRVYAEAEAKKIAQTLVMIETLRADGRINKSQAKILLDMQKQTSRVVLLTIEGLTLLAAEGAINAAMKSIRDTVNSALGLKLI